MRTPKHTPGPWEVTGPHSREVITTNPGTYKPRMTIAKVGGYWDGEAQANAALIAAAPVMYEALREAHELIRSLVAEEMIHGTELQRVGSCQANMWSALAQAEDKP